MAPLVSSANFDVRARELLERWLRWNEAYQQVTEQMFRQRENPEKLHDLLDDLDRLRSEVVSDTQQLLDS